MKFSIVIDQVRAVEWGLNLPETVLFAWLYNLPAWAKQQIIDDKVYYFASKNKVITDLPILTDKPDTVYRLYKQLQDKGLLFTVKVAGNDFVRLTAKAKEWNSFDNQSNGKLSEVGKKSDTTENNPDILGKLSENDSEKNPTYTNTINNTDTVTKIQNTAASPPDGNLFNEVPTIPTLQKQAPKEKTILWPWQDEKFKTEWQRWHKYKKAEFGKGYKTEDSENTAMRKLHRDVGGKLQDALYWIENAIAMNWQGLYQPKESFKPTLFNNQKPSNGHSSIL